jgi:hypothetical protein
MYNVARTVLSPDHRASAELMCSLNTHQETVAQVYSTGPPVSINRNMTDYGSRRCRSHAFDGRGVCNQVVLPINSPSDCSGGRSGSNNDSHITARQDTVALGGGRLGL